MVRSLLALGALVSLSGGALAQDISVSQLGINNGQESYVYYGMANGIHAYSIATTACNVGTVDVSWRDHLKDAPIIATNLHRMKSDGGFEQLAYSFVKFSTCSLDEGGNGCPGNCNVPFDCDWLTPDCSDTYWAELNDGKDGGARWEIDPVTGDWPAGNPTGPTGHGTIRGRLQVKDTEMQDAGALYFAESEYLSEDDQLAGNARNNYAWRKIEFPTVANIDNDGPTNMGDPAIYAWQAHANDVLIHDLTVQDEGGPGVHGWIFIGSRAIDLGGGLWRYHYAVQNGNSGRAVASLSIPLPCDGVNVTDVYFHDLDHHSGSPYGNADWAETIGTEMTWSVKKTHAENPDANAIRWGALYSFAFTADRAPAAGTAEVGLFVPGTPTSLSGQVIAPGALFQNYCSANPNSTGMAATVAALGSPYVADNDLRFESTQLPVNVPGYFMMSQGTDFVPNFSGSDGNLCLAAPQARFSDDVLFSGPGGVMNFEVDNTDLPQGITFDPGSTWYFQLWYRDPYQVPMTSNTTEGVTIAFCN